MVPVSLESELISGRIIHRTCIEGLKHKAKEIEEKISMERKAKEPDQEKLKKLYQIRENIASALQNAR